MKSYPRREKALSGVSLQLRQTRTIKNGSIMNPYDQPHDENEKATLRSMREVESSANMFYYTEE